MSVYLVTWDLNKEKPNYATARAHFVSRLNEYTTIKDTGLDSVRFVSASLSVQQIYTDLRKYLDDNDRIIVVKIINNEHYGWLSKEVWDWINARL